MEYGNAPREATHSITFFLIRIIIFHILVHLLIHSCFPPKVTEPRYDNTQRGKDLSFSSETGRILYGTQPEG